MSSESVSGASQAGDSKRRPKTHTGEDWPTWDDDEDTVMCPVCALFMKRKELGEHIDDHCEKAKHLPKETDEPKGGKERTEESRATLEANFHYCELCDITVSKQDTLKHRLSKAHKDNAAEEAKRLESKSRPSPLESGIREPTEEQVQKAFSIFRQEPKKGSSLRADRRQTTMGEIFHGSERGGEQLRASPVITTTLWGAFGTYKVVAFKGSVLPEEARIVELGTCKFFGFDTEGNQTGSGHMLVNIQICGMTKEGKGLILIVHDDQGFVSAESVPKEVREILENASKPKYCWAPQLDIKMTESSAIKVRSISDLRYCYWSDDQKGSNLLDTYKAVFPQYASKFIKKPHWSQKWVMNMLHVTAAAQDALATFELVLHLQKIALITSSKPDQTLLKPAIRVDFADSVLSEARNLSLQ